MLTPQKGKVDSVDSWTQSPNEEISAKAIGNYKNRLNNYQKYCILHSRLSNNYIKSHQLPFSSVNEALTSFDYLPLRTNQVSSLLKYKYWILHASAYILDIINRQFYSLKYNGKLTHVPGKINWKL
jgi:hypothetical protein